MDVVIWMTAADKARLRECDGQDIGGNDELRLDTRRGKRVAHGHVEDKAGGKEDGEQDERGDIEDALVGSGVGRNGTSLSVDGHDVLLKVGFEIRVS